MTAKPLVAATIRGYPVARACDHEAIARLRDVVFDCRNPAPLARFWASVLDGYAVAPYDDAELDRLGELGATVLTKFGDGHVLLTDPEGNEFCLMP